MSILFDLDGTLIDTAPDFVEAINALRAKDGKPKLTPEALRLVRIATSHSLPVLVEAGFGVKLDDKKSQALQNRLLESYQNTSRII